MNEATLKRYSQALITKFVKLHNQKYGRQPSDLNRYRDRWGFQAMIEDFGKARAEQIIDYYFDSLRSNHPVGYLLFNYDKLDEQLRSMEEDDETRKRLLEETKRRVEAWNGNQGG